MMGMGGMGMQGGGMPGMMRPMMGGMGGMMGGPGKGMGGPGMGMGGMKGGMPQQRPMGAPMQPRPMGMMPGAQPTPQPGAMSTTSSLANAPPGMQKQMLGEKIFPMISRIHPEMAGKITGMMP